MTRAKQGAWAILGSIVGLLLALGAAAIARGCKRQETTHVPPDPLTFAPRSTYG